MNSAIDTSSKYSYMTDIEHILERPENYMGANETVDKDAYTYDPISDTIKFGRVTYPTGVLKLFDEIFMNAIDNIRRGNTTQITIDVIGNVISIMNNGKAIDIKRFPNSDKYCPEVLFTVPRSGSNFNDSEERVTGGRNGIGCKLTSIFSQSFSVDIISNGLRYQQTYTENLKHITSPVITRTTIKDEHVRVTFTPDLKRFGVTSIDDTMKGIIYKRIHDVSYLPVNIVLNGKTLPKHSWNTFVKSYDIPMINDEVVYYENNTKDREWKIAFGVSKRSRNTSFVNYINTYDGGSHVRYIQDQIVKAVVKYIKSDTKNDIVINSTSVKSKLSVFVSATVVNPTFNGQSKEVLTSKIQTPCEIPKNIINDFLSDNSLIDILTDGATKKLAVKHRKSLNNVEKLVEANKAGGRDSLKCTLFLCEGLSAKTMVDAGMCIIGHDYYGVYPLRGKVLNARKASLMTYYNNRELSDIKAILGLTDGVEYDKTSKNLRYGKVVCVKDADSDGASIMGLVINFFQVKFPSLLRIPGFFSEFISPMIIVGPKQFYNEVEYRKYMSSPEIRKMKPSAKPHVRFIKGLATNEDSDIRQYFKEYTGNCLPMTFEDPAADKLKLAFDADCTDARKQWLLTITPETHLPRIKGKPIACSDFIDNDLVLYSMDACVRAIPSAIDGLKPSQRKILYTLFTMGKSAYNPIKVFQLGGLVAKTANYHHGDQSMNATIINMAQDYCGSNNIPILKRSGQFGSRQENGKDAGQPRYISCGLSKLVPLIFPEIDNHVLTYRIEDNQKVEPYCYVPIIPMALVNGARGMGTGWSTNIPAFNPIDIIDYVKCILTKNSTKPNIRSHYNGYAGDIIEESDKWVYHGRVTPKTSISSSSENGIPTYYEWIVTEIPINMSIGKFQQLLRVLSTPVTATSEAEKVKINESRIAAGKKPLSPENPRGALITKIVNNNTKDTNSIHYTITFVNKLSQSDVMQTLKLSSSQSKSNMVLFTASNKLRRYNTIHDIIAEWFNKRKYIYDLRIEYIIDDLEKQRVLADNKARFIKENIDGTITMHNIELDNVIQQLTTRKYDKIDNSYSYLLDMRIASLTSTHYNKLLADLKRIDDELTRMDNTTAEQLWISELDSLRSHL